LTGSQEVVGSNPIFSTLEAPVSNSRCFFVSAYCYWLKDSKL